MKSNPLKSPAGGTNPLPDFLSTPKPTPSNSPTLSDPEAERLSGEQLADFIEAAKAIPSQEEVPTLPAEFLKPSGVSDTAIPSGDAPLKRVKIGFTGHLKSGKDYVANAIGAQVHGFSEPHHLLCKVLFGSADKDKPGMRTIMQQIGECGRGIISEQCPASLQRAAFAAMIREDGEKLCPGLGVDWPLFGLTPDLWLNAALRRIDKSNNPLQVITGVRFENEIRGLTDNGFFLVHVLCSPSTWERRLKASGFTPDSPALQDVSEKLATTLDQNVTKEITRNPRGPKLLAVWSDEFSPPLSPRLLTVPDLHAWIARKQRGES